MGVNDREGRLWQKSLGDKDIVSIKKIAKTEVCILKMSTLFNDII